MNQKLLSDALDYIMTLNKIELQQVEFMLDYIGDSGLRHHIALKIQSNKRFTEYVLSRMNAKDREEMKKAMERTEEKAPSLSVIFGRLRLLEANDLAKYEDEVVKQIVLVDG